ncbi:MAG: CaiB/BaiF CoA transferase family protein [Promethearchaeota archaeon]
MGYPLEGVVILDFTRLLPGPYCTMVLADMGAEVIRIEDPSYVYAQFPPFYTKNGQSESISNTILMRNKKSISLNLKIPQSQKIVHELVKRSDVVVESFRPGVTEGLHIDYATMNDLNPNIIYCSLTGYGQTGPYAKKPGHDLNYQGYSGALWFNRNHFGEKNSDNIPAVPCTQTADLGGSLYAATSILGALYSRNRQSEKKGEYIDIAMMDCAVALNLTAFSDVFTPKNVKNLQPFSTSELLHGKFPCYRVYRTQDNKFISIAAIEHKFWANLCKILEFPDLIGKEFADEVERKEIASLLGNKFLERTLDEWQFLFNSDKTCASPVNTPDEALQNAQIKARECIQYLDHPRFGKIPHLVNPIRYSQSNLVPIGISPQLGEHNLEILESLGYTNAQIHDFAKLRCFGRKKKI